MFVSRFLSILAVVAGLSLAAPASAQFFLKSADLSGPRVTGAEPGMSGPALPDATPAELTAALIWNLRAALNVAALQCQFEPTLLTLDNYNAMLDDHEVELRDSYVTLEKYFTKANKTKKAGQTELDRFGTRVYSGFSTVSGQLSFCQTAASIGRQALFAPRGSLGEIAHNRMRELRSSLAAWGEQYRRTSSYSLPPVRLPAFSDPKCWKGGVYQDRRCGALATAVAAR
jgi:hypothetical protein